jgi:methyl-accepting chemotaxis protein
MEKEMIDSNDVKISLLELAERVEESDPDAAKRLMILGNAVVGSPYSRIWASSDVYKMINPDIIVERARSQRTTSFIVDMLEWIRNTFIFLPIIVTWYGISQATEAYNKLLSQLLKTNPNQVSQPFLYLWQQGFGGKLPGILTLSSIGLIDASILVVILILTFTTYFLSNLVTARKERFAHRLYSDLVHTLAAATLCLTSYVQQKPETAADNLTAVALRIEQMSSKITTDFDTMIRDVTSKFELSTLDITAKFNNMAAGVVGQFTTLAQQMTGQLDTGNQYLQQLGTFLQGIDTLSKNMEMASNDLKEANEKLSSSVGDLIEPAKDLSKQQQLLLGAVNGSVTLLQSAADKLDEVGIKQDAWSDKLTTTLESFKMAVDHVVDLGSNVGSFISQLDTFFQEIQEERDAQAELTDLMTNAVNSFHKTLDAMSDGTFDLRSISIDMKNVVNDLTRLRSAGYPPIAPVSPGASAAPDMSDAFDHYTQAADAMEQTSEMLKDAAETIDQSSRELNSSAIAIYQASQELKNVIDEIEQRSTKI